jgi:carboxyl-terminal processing protease
MRQRRRLAILIVLAALLFLGASSVAFRGARADSQAAKPAEGLADALQVIALLKTQYVDPISSLDLMKNYLTAGTIGGMLSKSLDDPYTRYMDKAAFSDMMIDTRGSFFGIGLYIALDQDERLIVVAPIEGTPAKRAGIKSGDHIVKIDDKSTRFMSTDQAASLMRGPKDTAVDLIIQRGKEELFFTIKRDEINVPAVTTEAVENHPKLYHLELSAFSEETVPQLEKALREIQSKGGEGIILDLRYNPGGLLNTAISVASYFLDKDQNVLQIIDRKQGKEIKKTVDVPLRTKLPVVVLVNKYSASASEILTGALKDNARAKVVGTKTFGKGLVQTIFPLTSGGAVSLTTQRYLTAGGKDINKLGIKPDYVVSILEEESREDGLPVALWTKEAAELKTEDGKTVKVPSGSQLEVAGRDEKQKRWQVEYKTDQAQYKGWISEENLQQFNPVDLQLQKAIEVLSDQLPSSELKQAS